MRIHWLLVGSLLPAFGCGDDTGGVPPDRDPPTIVRSALQNATPLFTEHDAFGWSAPASFVPQSPSNDAERKSLIDQTLDAEQARKQRAEIAKALIADATLDLAGFDAAEFLVIPQVSNSSPR